MTFIDFIDVRPIGTVLRVDTSQVVIEIEDHDIVTRLQVGGLAAVQGDLSTKFLIGIIDSVSRDITDLVHDSEDTSEQNQRTSQIGYSEQRDIVRLVLIGTYFSMKGERTNIFKRGADSFPSVARPCWCIEGQNLKALMQGLVHEVDEDKRLVLGKLVADSQVEAVADGDALFQRHCAIVGSTGSGKSWTLALLLEQAEKLQHSNIIVFDVHGEYSTLCSQTGADKRGYQFLKVAGKGMHFSEKEHPLYVPYWLLNFDELQAFMLDRTDQNAPNQASRLMHHIRDLKMQSMQRFGIPDEDSHFTINSPIPFAIEELLRRLSEDDQQMVDGAGTKQKQGEFHGKLTRFISRLETRLGDGRLAFMFQLPPECMGQDWFSDWASLLLSAEDSTSGIKIIDLSEVPSDALPLVTGVLGRLILELQFWRDQATRTPLVLMCDEAHLYVSSSAGLGVEERRAASVFERIAKEGRKYGTTLAVVSQRPAEISHTLLSQVNNFIVLRLTNDVDRAAIRSLLPDSMIGLIQSLQLMDIGEAMVVGDAMLLPSRIRLNEPAKKPGSSTYAVWSDWSTKSSDSTSVRDAVTRMRKQRRD